MKPMKNLILLTGLAGGLFAATAVLASGVPTNSPPADVNAANAPANAPAIVPPTADVAATNAPTAAAVPEQPAPPV